MRTFFLNEIKWWKSWHHRCEHHALMRELFVNYHNQTNVGRYMHEIRRKALVKPWHSFVPPCLLNAIPTACVAAVLVLQARPNHLVWVSGGGSNQLGYGRKQQVLGGCLTMCNGDQLDSRSKFGVFGFRFTSFVLIGRSLYILYLFFISSYVMNCRAP